MTLSSVTLHDSDQICQYILISDFAIDNSNASTLT